MRFCQAFNLFQNALNKFNDTGAILLEYIYHMTPKYLYHHVLACKAQIFDICNRCCYSRHYMSLHRGSYMSAHVLLNLLNDLGKR